jgi:hypothetical protein
LWPYKAQPQESPVPPALHQCGIDTTYTCHLKAEYVFGIGRNMLNRLEDDKYVYWQKLNHYYPFQDEDEWELGKFMVENLTQTQIIKFLKLKWVNVQAISSLLLNSFIVQHSL